jgi:hypothetical protein
MSEAEETAFLSAWKEISLTGDLVSLDAIHTAIWKLQADLQLCLQQAGCLNVMAGEK